MIRRIIGLILWVCSRKYIFRLWGSSARKLGSSHARQHYTCLLSCEIGEGEHGKREIRSTNQRCAILGTTSADYSILEEPKSVMSRRRMRYMVKKISPFVLPLLAILEGGWGGPVKLILRAKIHVHTPPACEVRRIRAGAVARAKNAAADPLLSSRGIECEKNGWHNPVWSLARRKKNCNSPEQKGWKKSYQLGS